MSLQSQAWLLTVQQMCGMFYGRCECCGVRWWGCGGLLWVLETAGCWVEIFLCTVEGCSEPPQQSTVFHGRHIKAGGEKNAWEGSLLTAWSYRFNLTMPKVSQSHLCQTQQTSSSFEIMCWLPVLLYIIVIKKIYWWKWTISYDHDFLSTL